MQSARMLIHIRAHALQHRGNALLCCDACSFAATVCAPEELLGITHLDFVFGVLGSGFGVLNEEKQAECVFSLFKQHTTEQRAVSFFRLFCFPLIHASIPSVHSFQYN